MTDTVSSQLETAMNAGEKTVTLTTASVAALLNLISDGARSARDVVDSWESGDLAGAVHLLEGWCEDVYVVAPDLAAPKYAWHVATDETPHVGLYCFDREGDPEDDFVQANTDSAAAQAEIERICNALNRGEMGQDDAVAAVRAIPVEAA